MITLNDATNLKVSMKNYKDFLDQKIFDDTKSGFIVDEVNNKLFDFQKVIVKWALQKGRAAIFADTGLGKTPMQCEWADKVANHTNGNVLILAPLSVAHQTVQIAKEFGIDIEYQRDYKKGSRIIITNYEMVDRFNVSDFEGIVLDESSILKSYTGKIRTKLIDLTTQVPYRLSCTATPSPNDFMELGNQSEFVGVMSRPEMLAMFFTHDGGETSKWRLKGHGQSKFWEWLSTWAVCIRKPSDLGYDDAAYDLPPLNIFERIVKCDHIIDGQLFQMPAQTLSEQRSASRLTMINRVSECANLVNNSNKPWIVWCQLNDESDALVKAIPGSVSIQGSDSIDHKEKTMDAFSDGRLRVLVSKPSICGYGMNWQHCANQAFVGVDHSFEKFYQAIRRSWRFGQTHPVDVHVFTSDLEGQVLANIKRKQAQHDEMASKMIDHMRGLMQQKITGTKKEKAMYVTEKKEGDGWELYLGDCIDIAKDLDDGAIDYTIFSPPFASLYTYSNSERDMGNCKDDNEFYKHFSFLVDEMFRITRSGRLLSFHCMNLPTSKQNHGYIGIRDFRGELIRMFVNAGWIYHSEVVIWKDPVIAMQRTKALGLLHKQLKKDSTMSRQGIPDYVVTMRKPGENNKRVGHTNGSFPVELWQRYASPVWMDINPSRTLQYRSARENDDERHICPLQLDVIERCIDLWTTEGDIVFSPFAGIGSEGYVALQSGRKFIGAELKKSYFNLAVKNLQEAKSAQGGLFNAAASS